MPGCRKTQNTKREETAAFSTRSNPSEWDKVAGFHIYCCSRAAGQPDAAIREAKCWRLHTTLLDLNYGATTHKNSEFIPLSQWLVMGNERVYNFVVLVFLSCDWPHLVSVTSAFHACKLAVVQSRRYLVCLVFARYLRILRLGDFRFRLLSIDLGLGELSSTLIVSIAAFAGSPLRVAVR